MQNTEEFSAVEKLSILISVIIGEIRTAEQVDENVMLLKHTYRSNIEIKDLK